MLAHTLSSLPIICVMMSNRRHEMHMTVASVPYRNVSWASSCTISSKRSRLGTQLCIKWQFWSSTHPPSLANLSPYVNIVIIREWQTSRLFPFSSLNSKNMLGTKSADVFHTHDEMQLSDPNHATLPRKGSYLSTMLSAGFS